MNNIPQVKLGIVAVSRDCFPIELSQRRRKAVVDAFRNAGGEIVEIMTTVENESDALKALDEKYRLPIVLHYLEGYSLEEIAWLLRIPAGTVKSRMHAGRRALKAMLEEG